MNFSDRSILRFPCASSAGGRGALRENLLKALRVSGSPVIVDFSHCSLNGEDIELLIECVAMVAGRDTQLLFVAGSRVNRVLLEMTRIDSLVPVFNSMEQAHAYPQIAAENSVENLNGAEHRRAGQSCANQSHSLGGA